ncbi:MAG TPA: hypothetical protein VIF09_09930 [Polyangiaceae bacterium]
MTDRKAKREHLPTAPPPFDPEEFARSSESALRTASDTRRTAENQSPPPLNKRVRIAVPAEDLEWFELSPGARALLERIDGTKTLFDLLEGTANPEILKAISELHDARILAYAD